MSPASIPLAANAAIDIDAARENQMMHTYEIYY